jgi:hypothetical protein
VLPDWLAAALQDAGQLDAPGTGTRRARLGRCPACRAQVLRGLDGERAAGLAVVNAEEIDTSGEFLALMLGLRTYTLTRGRSSTGAASWNLDPREPCGIRAGQRTALVAEHRCGVAIPPARESRIPRWMQSKPLPDAAPF